MIVKVCMNKINILAGYYNNTTTSPSPPQLTLQNSTVEHIRMIHASKYRIETFDLFVDLRTDCCNADKLKQRYKHRVRLRFDPNSHQGIFKEKFYKK